MQAYELEKLGKNSDVSDLLGPRKIEEDLDNKAISPEIKEIQDSIEDMTLSGDKEGADETKKKLEEALK